MTVERIDVLKRILTVAIALQAKELVLGRVFQSDIEFLRQQIDEFLKLVREIAEVPADADTDWLVEHVNKCAQHRDDPMEITYWLFSVSKTAEPLK